MRCCCMTEMTWVGPCSVPWRQAPDPVLEGEEGGAGQAVAVPDAHRVVPGAAVHARLGQRQRRHLSTPHAIMSKPREGWGSSMAGVMSDAYGLDSFIRTRRQPSGGCAFVMHRKTPRP